MDKITRLACLVLLLVCSNYASASLILDTGATPGDNAWASRSHQWMTDDRYSIDVDALFTEIEHYKGITRLHSDVVQKGAWWPADWMIDRDKIGRKMAGHDFFTKKHPRWKKRYFEHKWHHHDHIPAVPVPAAVWLFGSGLIGLIGFARKKA